MAPFVRFVLFCGLMLTASCSTSVAPSPETTQPPPTQQSPVTETPVPGQTRERPPAIETAAPIPTSPPTGVPTPSSSSGQDLFPPLIRIGLFRTGQFRGSEGYLESYCWSGVPDETGSSAGECRRFPPKPVDEDLQLHSAGGGSLEFKLDPPLPDALTLLVYQDLASPPVFSDQILSPGEKLISYLSPPNLPPGDYVLYVSAIWEGRGNAKYSFAISIPKDEERLPELHLLVGERTRVPGMVVGFCWMGGCGDGSLVLELFTPLYSWDRTLRLQFEEPIPDRVTLRIYDDLLLQEQVIASDVRSLEGPDITWEVELPSGYYVLSAFAKWDEPSGDASYFFGVIVP